MLWDELAQDWGRYAAPICPDSADLAHFRAGISGADDHVLLLGVTPLLAGLGRKLTSVDTCRSMIDLVWPGDNETRRAVQGNWLFDLAHAAGFTAAITDGGLSVLRWPDQYVMLFASLRAAGAPQCRLIARCHFSANVQPTPDLAVLRAELRSGLRPDPDLVRFRVAHALVAASGEPNIAVRETVRVAAELLHDQPEARASLLARPHAHCDESYSFPNPVQLIELIEDCGFWVDHAGLRSHDPFVHCTVQ